MRYFGSFNLFAVNKDILYFVSLSKLLGRLFTTFTVYIVSVFLACFYSGRACDRLSAWTCSLKRAVYNTPDSLHYVDLILNGLLKHDANAPTIARGYHFCCCRCVNNAGSPLTV